jgi:hypothetical protein
MSRFTLFLDVAGRVCEATQGYEYITCAGVAFESAEVSNARDEFGNDCPKWRDSGDRDTLELANFVANRALKALILRIEKRQPAWKGLWKDAGDYHRQLSALSEKPVGFVKAAQFVRYMLFSECIGRLLAECVAVTGRPRVLDSQNRGVVEMSVVCDSDIEGPRNIEGFHIIWEMLERSPQEFPAKLGLVLTVRSAVLATEVAEPLLLCADHLAGLFHCLVVPRAKPRSLSQRAAEEARIALANAKKVVVVDKPFDIPYRAMKQKGIVGQFLWGTAKPPTPADDRNHHGGLNR